MPPYCGVPRLSHQFPVAVVVVGIVVVAVSEVVVVVVLAVVDVVLVLDVVDVGVDVDVAHEASSIAVTSKKLKPNQMYLFFNFLLLFC